jgi:hypothetical protein
VLFDCGPAVRFKSSLRSGLSAAIGAMSSAPHLYWSFKELLIRLFRDFFFYKLTPSPETTKALLDKAFVVYDSVVQKLKSFNRVLQINRIHLTVFAPLRNKVFTDIAFGNEGQ